MEKIVVAVVIIRSSPEISTGINHEEDLQTRVSSAKFYGCPEDLQ